MVVFKKRKVESALLKKGFIKKNKPHKFYYLYVDNFDVGIYTKMSHGGNEISDFLVSSMARQIGISKKDFIDVVKCPIDRDELVRILREEYQKIP